MASQVGHRRQESTPTETFIEDNFAAIAFVVSSLALVILSPGALIVGAAVGFGLSAYFEPHLKVYPNENILTLPNATISIVGGFAALLRLSPAGATSSMAFKAVPIFAAMAIGNTIYRAYRVV